MTRGAKAYLIRDVRLSKRYQHKTGCLNQKSGVAAICFVLSNALKKVAGRAKWRR